MDRGRGQNLSEVSKQFDPNVWAPRAQRWRQERVQKFADYCVKMEGQDLTLVMKTFSRESGVSMRTVQEYWDVVSPDNRSAIQVKNGIIRVKERRLKK
jgi:hypothetical protein